MPCKSKGLLNPKNSVHEDIELQRLSKIKEILYLNWNERHLRAYFETLMTLLQT